MTTATDTYMFSDEDGNTYNFYDRQAREIAQGAAGAAAAAQEDATAGLLLATRAHDAANGLGRGHKDYVKLGRCIEEYFASEVTYTGIGKWLGQRIAAADEGGYDDLSLRDYTKIDLLNPAGSQMIYQLGAFDHYTGAGDQINPHMLTFVPAVVYPDTVQFNTTNNNNGTAAEPVPWRASNLFNWCNTTFYNYLPQDIKERLLEVRLYMHNRYASGGSLTADNGGSWNTPGKVWVPDEIEVWGSVRLGSPQNGATLIADTSKQLPIFADGSVIRCHNGNRCYWWERTAASGGAAYACNIDYNGNSSCNGASSTGLLPLPCFHLGAKAGDEITETE